MERTAIEWYHNNITIVCSLLVDNKITKESADEMIMEYRKKADEMFFEQIMDANRSGVDMTISGTWESGRDYFKRKYGTN